MEEEQTKTIKIKKSLWKKLLGIKTEKDFSNMSEVIEDLLKSKK